MNVISWWLIVRYNSEALVVGCISSEFVLVCEARRNCTIIDPWDASSWIRMPSWWRCACLPACLILMMLLSGWLVCNGEYVEFIRQASVLLVTRYEDSLLKKDFTFQRIHIHIHRQWWWWTVITFNTVYRQRYDLYLHITIAYRNIQSIFANSK